jgi:hypothetical protein
VILLAIWLVYARLMHNSYRSQITAQTVAIKHTFGVAINYDYSPGLFFPHGHNARGTQARLSHIASTLPLIERFLATYPAPLVNKTLSDIFLLATLEFNGKQYGGTYIGSAIYITTGHSFRHADASLLGLLHAEFSSILFNHFSFPKDQWAAVNNPSFRYLGSGFDMLDGEQLYDQTPALLEAGFLNAYSRASMEEDFNAFAEWTFTNPHRLKTLALTYTRIRQKCALLINFYHSLEPQVELPAQVVTAVGSRPG